MKRANKQGFTIIEVVLVLAIAGLIFLMVFVALPALQRSQRDTQRRQDYADLLSSITSYMTNNNGSLPGDSATLPADKYINSTGNGPSGNAYTITVITCGNSNNCGISDFKDATSDAEGSVYIVKSATCNDGAPVKVGSKKAFAVYGGLETGRYCQGSNSINNTNNNTDNNTDN